MKPRTRAIATLLLGLAAGSAYATPANLLPGASDVPVPLYAASGTPSVGVLADTGLQTLTADGITLSFEEVAVRTSLNPSGVSFAFALAASNAPSSLGATLPGYAGFTTAVESCDPFALGATGVCGTATGTAARSAGTGNVVSFAGIGTTPVSIPVVGTTNVSNVYAIFTNAPSFADPQVTVVDDGVSFTFDGIAPAGTTSVPEPGTLALFVLACAALALSAYRRARAVPRA